MHWTHREEAADKRKEVQSAADLAQDVVGGNIPRTLLKLLTYCRVSDKDTCQVRLTCDDNPSIPWSHPLRRGALFAEGYWVS